MRTAVVFLTGLLVGSAITTGVLAQGNKLAGMKGVNHVAMSVDNFEGTLDFYTQKMGFREVLNMHNDQNQPTLAFVQASRDTFLELAPANANRPVGITHFGLLVDDINMTVASLRQRGVMVTDPRTVGEQWMVANVTAPGGIRIELTQLGPDSVPMKAASTWAP
ncbi:MAG TPA: VOC family protein [Candidatus Acidoferrales bacterium]|nr:VOC family protein [Candidatus Acidoferrales bacterium]